MIFKRWLDEHRDRRHNDGRQEKWTSIKQKLEAATAAIRKMDLIRVEERRLRDLGPVNGLERRISLGE